MANLIDITYFVGDINIPNIDDANVSSRLTFFITKHSQDFLKKILGYALFKRLSDESEAITALLSGAEYTDDNGDFQKWNGLVDSTNKISFIANYVFFKWVDDASNQFSGSAFYTPKADDRILVAPIQKSKAAWDLIYAETYNMVCYLLSNSKKDLYPEYSSQLASYALFYTKPINSFDI